METSIDSILNFSVVIWVIFGFLFMPVLLGWLLILISPFVILFGGLFASIGGGVRNLEHHAHSIVECSEFLRARIQLLARRLGHGVTACMCVLQTGPMTRITARFDDGKSAWSHRVQGVDLDDATHRMENRLDRSGEKHISGLRPICVSCGGCPNDCDESTKSKAVVIFHEKFQSDG